MFKTYLDSDGDTVFSMFWGMIRLTFYKPWKGWNPIVTWFRDTE